MVWLSGGHRYLDCQARQVRVLTEGAEERPKWHAHVLHTVFAGRVQPPAPPDVLSLDHNVRQDVDSDDHLYALPDTSKLDVNIRRKQRQADKACERFRRNGQPRFNRGRCICGQLSRLQRRKKCPREATDHQHSRQLADAAHTVVEDLYTKAMTRSCSCRVKELGRNVKQKSGLNRGILKSNRGRMERHLSCKAGELVRVAPAHTSRTCAVCQHVDRENRKIRAVFRCTACGHTTNADRNAAVNILSGPGLSSNLTGPRGRGICTTRGNPVGDRDDP